MTSPYEQAAAFHAKFHPVTVTEPTAFSSAEASLRAGFKVEELVEFLAAASDEDRDVFAASITQLEADLAKAVKKSTEKPQESSDPLVAQSDALLDLLYFTYGSFVLMGVDPTEMFDIVHHANMGKVFPDGHVHRDPVTGKVLKPVTWERECAPEAKLLAEIERQKKKSQATT